MPAEGKTPLGVMIGETVGAIFRIMPYSLYKSLKYMFLIMATFILSTTFHIQYPIMPNSKYIL